MIDLKRAWSGPVWVIVPLCSGLPLVWMIFQFARNPIVLNELHLDSFRVHLLGRTILYNGLAAAIATMIAIPPALVIGRGNGPLTKILFFALPVSLLLPSIIYAYGWSQFFRLLDVHLFPASPGDIARCIWTLATWLWPVPAALIGLSLRRMDSQVQQQAMLDGALARITFRHIAAPILASFALAMMLAVQEFAVYEPTGISVVATEVRMVFDTGAFSSATNPITAAISGQGVAETQDQRARAAAALATSLPLLAVTLTLCGFAFFSSHRLATHDEIAVGPHPAALQPKIFTQLLAAATVIIAVIVPMISLAVSLHRVPSLLFIFEEFRPQVLGAQSIGLLTAIAALAIAFFETVRKTFFPLILAILTFLIGGQLLAISQIRIYNRPWLSFIYNAAPIMVIVYLARFGWIILLAARSTWPRQWKDLRDIAEVDGASPLQTAMRVIWPLAAPLLAAAAVLIMVLCITEVPATVLISPQRPQMLTPTLMTWVHMLRYDAMIEASLVLVAAVAIFVAAAVALVILRRKIFVAVAILALFHLSCFDSSKPDAIWCDTGTGPGQVVYPRGITYSPSDDSFFIVDRVARIQHLTHDGKYLGEWRMPDWKLGKPVGISVGPDGLVYVPDTHYQRVIVYKPDGSEVRRWGKNGTAPGEFIYPTDVAFDAKGHVFVSEYGDNDRIQVFTPDGKFLYQFGKFGDGPGQFVRPQSMVIDGETLYVTDACNHRICVFKTDGTFVRNMGKVGSGLGEFRFPYGLEMDNRGHLIVCEFGNNRVQMIDKQTGRGLKTWGSAGREPGQLAYPWAVAVDKSNRVVAVDAGNNRLQVFEF